MIGLQGSSALARSPTTPPFALDIQETVLFLPPTERGRDAIHARQLQALAALPDWQHQRRRWQELCSSNGLGTARPPVGE
jgi:hypothetical protein